MSEDAKKILKFIQEIDKFKYISRVVHLQKENLLEDDAQHSWHLAMMVWLFAHLFEKRINLEKALKMALMHDLVEIYAGDTFAYDTEGRKNKRKREEKAAKKLFQMLTPKLKLEMEKLWQEYERRVSPESIFVQALDKFHPFMQVILAKGKTWREHHITEQMIVGSKTPYFASSDFLTKLFKYTLSQAKRKKYLYR